MVKENFIEIEEEIRMKNSLPYTVTVEKVEGNKVFTHNIWGNSVVYLQNKDGSYSVSNEE
jgi:hypothetical protein